ncbi:MAG: hypothetical protein C3F13_12870 [Anaerolineales bacterium]|nr:YggT family protein [Anaerolineae bacterium]PWB51796.1 MAG: hypothetical protein C3F13_12870 [Anaerolineales bacterium]
MAETNQVSEIRSEEWEPDLTHRSRAQIATQVVALLVSILEALLALRFLLKLIAANPHSPIAVFIYAVTDLLLTPFAGLTATPSADGMILEISTLIAMLVYGLVGWFLQRLTWIVLYRPRGSKIEVTRTRKHEDRSRKHQTQS